MCMVYDRTTVRMRDSNGAIVMLIIDCVQLPLRCLEFYGNAEQNGILFLYLLPFLISGRY
jgi:hypothetical protein